MDYHKEDCQEDIYSDVQAASGSSEDSRCLLDAICGVSTSPGVSGDFMLFWLAPLGACCCQIPTRGGHAAVWICEGHSRSACRFMGVI